MKLVAFLLCLCSLAACASAPSAPTGPINAQVVLTPLEAKAISGAGIRIRFQGVFGDSRCPADVVCIQGGDAIVRIDVIPDEGAPATYNLHTGNMQPVHHADMTIALERLDPYPFSSRTIEPGAYRATLRITR